MLKVKNQRIVSEWSIIVPIGPDLSAIFPDTDAGNRTLRSHAEEHKMLRQHAARLRPSVAAPSQGFGAATGGAPAFTLNERR